MALALALAFAAVSWLYFRGGFSDIHWLGPRWAAAFLLHALLCLALAMRWVWRAAAVPQASGLARAAGLTLLLAAAAWPALAPLSQRPLWQAEVVGLAPDATVLLSLGLLLAWRLPRLCGAALLVVPLAWCAFSGATLWAMQQAQALVLPLAGVLAVVAVCLGGRLPRPA